MLFCYFWSLAWACCIGKAGAATGPPPAGIVDGAPSNADVWTLSKGELVPPQGLYRCQLVAGPSKEHGGRSAEGHSNGHSSNLRGQILSWPPQTQASSMNSLALLWSLHPPGGQVSAGDFRDHE